MRYNTKYKKHHIQKPIPTFADKLVTLSAGTYESCQSNKR